MSLKLINNKIARRLVIYILVCSSVITLILTAHQLWREYRADVSAIELRLQQIGLSDVRSISQALWVFDTKSIEIQIEGLASLPDMQYLSVVNSDESMVAHTGIWAETDVIETVFPLEYVHRDEKIHVGQLSVQASLLGVYGRLIDQAIFILLTQALKTFIVSVFIFLIVQWMITRHLETIATYTETIDLNTENPLLVLGRKRTLMTRDDELDRVVDALNTMEKKLWSAYQEIRTHRDQLDRRVQERTRELEQANKELTSFCYTVSHDLRAPLRSINGFSDALIESHSPQLDEDGVEYLNRVKAAAVRMGELIDDLLSLSRVSQMDLVVTDIDISAICREIAHHLKQSHLDRSVEWNIQDGMQAKADTRLMRIALENLLGNAWKYSGKTDHARIDIGASRKDDSMVFFIRDNGAGFDMHYVDKLFKPFHRLHPASEFEGTGIGLATVERIIFRHKGSLWAEGEEGKGATFYFSLPVDPIPA